MTTCTCGASSSGSDIPPSLVDRSVLAVNPAFAGLDFDGTLGAYEVGVLISMLMLGIATAQTYQYYTRFPKDKLSLKIFVACVMALEYGHTVAVCMGLYRLTVSSYGDLESLQTMQPSITVSLLLCGFIAFLVQMFFTNRVRIISGRLPIPLFCYTLTTLRFIATLVVTCQVIKFQDIGVFVKQYAWLPILSHVLGVVVDVTIAVSLIWYLVDAAKKQGVGLKSTTRVMDKLIMWTIETGTITSMTGIIWLIVFFKMRDNLVWLGVLVCIGRIYSNSLLASLNARESLRGLREPMVEISLSLPGGTRSGATATMESGLNALPYSNDSGRTRTAIGTGGTGDEQVLDLIRVISGEK